MPDDIRDSLLKALGKFEEVVEPTRAELADSAIKRRWARLCPHDDDDPDYVAPEMPEQSPRVTRSR